MRGDRRRCFGRRTTLREPARRCHRNALERKELARVELVHRACDPSDLETVLIRQRRTARALDDGVEALSLLVGDRRPLSADRLRCQFMPRSLCLAVLLPPPARLDLNRPFVLL